MRERDIFIEALQKASLAERAAYLDGTCAGDEALRRRVERLLAEHEKRESFMLDAPPALAGNAETIDQPPATQPGTVIGPYKLLQKIGEGGMGVVWMAEQMHPVQRKVALKVIKPGMDSRQVIARFEAERQALAMMDHVNIARVFDGGTTDAGRPYFVMELVHGVPITKYCDDNHLTPRERLELFVPVCQAIQHAHQKGIIHRDIKPSNVMVTLYDGKPVPKVIDFGVAKATEQKLTERTLFTQYGTMVGTLEYMSPEQAEMSALGVDTRSDIYSLGVLLYELLTGNTPLTHLRMKEVAYAEILRMIKEVEPPKPSTRLSDSGEALASISANRHTEPAKLTKLVRGELDWIVMKSLEKDRNRRYETANGFAADVQRYLADEPVQACPPSALYRFRKFARRNRGAIAVAALILFFLVLLGSGTGWAVRDRSARDAELARDRAVRQAKVSGQVELILDEVERLAREHKWPEALGVAKRAEAALAGDKVDPATSERVSQELADLEMVARLEEIRLSLSEAGLERSLLDSAGTAQRYAAAFRECDADIEALPLDQAAARLRARMAVVVPLAAALDDWGGCCRRMRNERLAKDLWALAGVIDPAPWRLRVRQAIAARDVARLVALAETPDSAHEPPHSQVLLAYGLRNGGRPAEAIALLERASDTHPADFWIHFELGALNSLVRPKGLEAALRHYTVARALRPRSAMTWINRGVVYKELGQLDKAIADNSKAIELNPKAAIAWINRGSAYSGLGQHEKAIADSSKAIELDPKFPEGWNNRGFQYTQVGELDKALADLSKAIELDPKHALALCNRGEVYGKLGQSEKALADYSKAIEADPKYAVAWYNRGVANGKLGHLDKALADSSKAIDLDPKFAKAWTNRGVAYLKLRQFEKALADCSKAIELDPKDPLMWTNRGLAYHSLGQLDKAVADFSKAIELNPKKPNAFYVRGATYSDHLQQYDLALADFSRAIELQPDNANAWYRRGQAYREKRQYENALADYTKAIELDPNSAELHNSLAWFLVTCPDAKFRDPARAVKLAKKAVELASKQAAHWNTLGIAQYRAGEWKAATDAMHKVMELSKGGDGGQRYLLAMAHWQLNQKDEARRWYDQAEEWMTKNQEALKETKDWKEISRFRVEATDLLGIKKK